MAARRCRPFAGASDSVSDDLRSRAGERYRGDDAAWLGVSAMLYLPAIALSAGWVMWFEGWDEIGEAIPAAWIGLQMAASDPDSARVQLDLARAALIAGQDTVSAYDHLIPIMLAESLGETDMVAELLELASSCPLRINAVDLAWGFVR